MCLPPRMQPGLTDQWNIKTKENWIPQWSWAFWCKSCRLTAESHRGLSFIITVTDRNQQHHFHPEQLEPKGWRGILYLLINTLNKWTSYSLGKKAVCIFLEKFKITTCWCILERKEKKTFCEDLQVIHRNAVICQKHETELKSLTAMTCRSRYQHV